MKSHTKYYKIKKVPDFNLPYYKGCKLTYQSKAIVQILEANDGVIERTTLLKEIKKRIFTHQSPESMLRWWQSKLEKAGIITIEKIKLT